jgi:hypothetical protein
MRLTSSDLAVLIPAFKVSEQDVHKLFNQLSCIDEVPFLFFAYESDSCTFDFSSIVDRRCKLQKIEYRIMPLSDNRGIGYALCSAVAEIKQAIVMRHDLGDDFLENRIRDTLDAFNNVQEIDVLYSQAILSDGMTEKLSEYPHKRANLAKAFITGNPICHPTVVFKRSAIIRIGNYDPNLRFCEDLDLWLRAIQANLRFHCLDRPTIRYYRPTSARSNGNWKANLYVRLKNFGAPNFSMSLTGIAVILAYIMMPNFIKNKIYRFVKD